MVVLIQEIRGSLIQKSTRYQNIAEIVHHYTYAIPSRDRPLRPERCWEIDTVSRLCFSVYYMSKFL